MVFDRRREGGDTAYQCRSLVGRGTVIRHAAAQPASPLRVPVVRPALLRAPMSATCLAKALQPTLEATLAAAIHLPSEARRMYVEAARTSSAL